MFKPITAALFAGLLTTTAFAQTYAQTTPGKPGDPFGSDKGAQNLTLTIQTLTVANCDQGYQQGMSFPKQEFDTRCVALRAVK